MFFYGLHWLSDGVSDSAKCALANDYLFKKWFYLNHSEGDVMDIQKGCWEELAGREQGVEN